MRRVPGVDQRQLDVQVVEDRITDQGGASVAEVRGRVRLADVQRHARRREVAPGLVRRQVDAVVALQGVERLHLGAQTADFGGHFGDGLDLGIFFGRGDKGVADHRPRSHPRLKLGKARFNKRDTLRGDFGHASD